MHPKIDQAANGIMSDAGLHALGAVLSVIVIIQCIAGAALGYADPFGLLIAFGFLAAGGSGYCIATLVRGPHASTSAMRGTTTFLSAIVGAALVIAGTQLAPDHEIATAEYGRLAELVARKPYAAALLDRARSDGVITRDERRRFERELAALERRRVIDGL